MDPHLISKYLFAKQIICDEGYSDEIFWQNNVNFRDLEETNFIRELSWVILTTGMKEQVVRKIFYKITPCFLNWESAEIIVKHKNKCYNTSIKIFRNNRKINAIIQCAEKIDEIGFNRIKEKIEDDPIQTLLSFPYIGKITVYHIAKNIGICLAKPDRHLVRIANREGFDDVQKFCKFISEKSGDSIPVVDIVLWRFANLTKDYLEVFSSINFN